MKIANRGEREREREIFSQRGCARKKRRALGRRVREGVGEWRAGQRQWQVANGDAGEFQQEGARGRVSVLARKGERWGER